MPTKITSKQVKVINDVSFNNHKITNAKIDASENDITGLSIELYAGNNISIDGSTISAIVPTKVSELDNDSQYITNVVDDLVNYTTTANLASVALSGDYNDLINKPIIDSTLSDSSTNAVENRVIKNEFTRIESLTITNASNIILETSNRQTADNNLQSQIDAITVASDVTDVVGTYQDLQNYDTQHLKDNDIIKVLQDNTHNNASSYYRWNDTTEQFSYIGSEGPYYTKSEADEIFVPQTLTINNIGLSNNITLTKNDIGLGNVDNTSDLNKPISNATQNALDNKQDKLNEFVVTEEIFNKYKKAYYAGGDVLDIADMIDGEGLYGYCDINLNSYTAYLDGYTIQDAYYSLANGSIILDNIQEGGCGRAVVLNDAALILKNCYISVPQCEDSNVSIFELDNYSYLACVNNSSIFAHFTERKSLIKVGTNCSLEIDNISKNLDCKQGLQDSNFGFDFVEVVGDNSDISIKKCQCLRMANDNADTDDGIEYNFIKTAEGKIVTINMFNNVIWMHGRGHSINKKILNVNLDNIDCQISNNDLQGNLYCRYESNNTITAKFEESGGEPVTFNAGDEVYDLYLTTEPMEESRGFDINDMLDFLGAVHVDQNDMQQANKEFKFEWHTIDNQSGFILNYDPEETYTTSDLISLTDLETNYSIHADDENPEDWEDEDWLGVYLKPNGHKFRIENTFILETANTFWQQIQNGNASEIQANIYSFNNNSFNSEEGGYPNFFTNSSNSISTNRLVLNGKEYTEIEIKQTNQFDYYEFVNIIERENIDGYININNDVYLEKVNFDSWINKFTFDGTDWLIGDEDAGETTEVIDLSEFGIDVSQATYSSGSFFYISSTALRDKDSIILYRGLEDIISVYINGNLQLKKDWRIENSGNDEYRLYFEDYLLGKTDTVSILYRS